MKNDQFYIGDPPGWLNQWNYDQPVPEIKKVKRITKTVDKYDDEGKLISREIITQDEEIIDIQIWPSSTFTLTNHHTSKLKGLTATPFSLTNGMEISNFVADY